MELISIFTLGSIQELNIPTAQITSTNASICEGDVYELEISLTGNGPWEIKYSNGSVVSDWILVDTTTHIIYLSPTS
jgi:hypothetical protein